MRLINYTHYLSRRQVEIFKGLTTEESILSYMGKLGFKEVGFESTEGLGRFVRHTLIKSGYDPLTATLTWNSSDCSFQLRFCSEKEAIRKGWR